MAGRGCSMHVNHEGHPPLFRSSASRVYLTCPPIEDMSHEVCTDAESRVILSSLRVSLTRYVLLD